MLCGLPSAILFTMIKCEGLNESNDVKFELLLFNILKADSFQAIESGVGNGSN